MFLSADGDDLPLDFRMTAPIRNRRLDFAVGGCVCHAVSLFGHTSRNHYQSQLNRRRAKQEVWVVSVAR